MKFRIVIEKSLYPSINNEGDIVPVKWHFLGDSIGECKIIFDHPNKQYIGEFELLPKETVMKGSQPAEDKTLINRNIAAIEALLKEKCPLYPAIQGTIIRREGNIIKEAKIIGVSICTNNVDPSIPPISI